MSDPQRPSPTFIELIKLTESYFAQRDIASPRVDAEILLAHVLGMKRIDLYLHHDDIPTSTDLDRFREMVRRRAKGTPVQQLTGDQDFYALKIQVSEKALIPRPETEVLVERIFREVAPEGDRQSRRVAEIGTGTGAIAIALATGWVQAEIWAVDLSLDALDVARGNVAFHGLDSRIQLVHGNLFESLDNLRDGLDLVVSNPPYIPTPEIAELAPEVRDHEPHLALDGGLDGLSVIRPLITQAPRYLRPGAWLFLEIGHGQGNTLRKMLDASGNYDNINIYNDLSDKERIAAAQRKA